MSKKKVTDYKPDENNANAGTERGQYMVDTSIREYGAGRSILVDKHGNVIAGNKTLQASVDAGIEDVVEVEVDGNQLVVVKRKDLDLYEDDKARLLAYADNRASELGLEWNADAMLADIEGGLDLSSMFVDDEIQDIISKASGFEPPESEDAEAQVSRADELREEWGVESGQMWRLATRSGEGEHRIICGDCTDVLVVSAVVGGDEIGLVSVDPPYGIGLDNDNQTIGKSKAYNSVVNDGDSDTARVLFDALRHISGSHVWWGGNHWGGELLPSSSCWLVWDKDHHGMTFADAELAWTNLEIPVRVFRHAWSGNHRASEVGVERMHINQKPVALYEWVIAVGAGELDCIFDGCLGSGSQLIACENLSRYCRAIEISPAYVAVALQRYYDAFGIRGELIDGG